MLQENPASSRARLLLAGAAAALSPDSVDAVYGRLITLYPNQAVLQRDFASVLIRSDRMVYDTLAARSGDELDKKTAGILNAHLLRFDAAAAWLEPLLLSHSDADVAYYLGNVRLGQKRNREAAECFGRAIAADSTNPSAWINRGIAFLRDNRFDSAAAFFEAAEHRFPSEASLNYLAGTAYNSEKLYKPAVAQYRAALAKDTGNAEILFSLAAALERKGDFNESEKRFLALIARDSTDHRTLNYLGYMYAEKGIHLDRAEQFIRRALMREPDNAAYLDSYGWVKYQTKDFAGAETYLRQAAAGSGNDPVILEHLAAVLEALGKTTEAADIRRHLLNAESNP